LKLQPLSDRILVRPLIETETKKGLIYIPETAKEKPVQGEVIEIGSGKVTEDGKQIPMNVKKGDQVLYGKYSGTEITLGDIEHLILREADVLAIIEN